ISRMLENVNGRFIRNRWRARAKSQRNFFLPVHERWRLLVGHNLIGLSRRCSGPEDLDREHKQTKAYNFSSSMTRRQYSAIHCFLVASGVLARRPWEEEESDFIFLRFD